jgi:dihydrofolate reductase
MRLSVIVAMDRNGLIGGERGLPWHLPHDLRRFRDLTRGNPVIMGRSTHEHIGRPLPGRHNIVLSRRNNASFAGCTVAASLDEALRTGGDEAEDIFVIGGAEVYRQTLARADRIFLTIVEGEFEGTTFFPVELVQRGQWIARSREIIERDEKNAHRHLFFMLERTQSGDPSGSYFDLAATLRHASDG